MLSLNLLVARHGNYYSFALSHPGVAVEKSSMTIRLLFPRGCSSFYLKIVRVLLKGLE